METFNLFISHSWRHGDTYDRLINLLRQRSYFDFKDYSVPKDDPIHNAPTSSQLREAIKDRMRTCGVVLIMCGVYATYSKWINEEMDLTKNGFSRPKPIIGIKPRGYERLSTVVQEAADELVGWNTESIIDAIRKLG